MDGVTTMTGTAGTTTNTNTNNGTSATDDGNETDTPVDETVTPPTGDPPTGTTIYDIQMGDIEPGVVVTLEGVVVVSPVKANETDAGLNGDAFIQEPDGGPYSGIRLYLFGEVVTGVPLEAGDVITITGEVQEFFDETQLQIASVDDIQVTGTGTVPTPVAVTASDLIDAPGEAYEGVPVCLSDVAATEATNQFGDFHVDGGAAVTNLFLFGTPDFLDVLPGTQFARLCGPVAYSFEEYKIAPRNPADYDATLVGCAEAAQPATIQQIQMGMFDTDDLVVVSDVVVTSPWNFDGDTFWVQDGTGPNSGISVYLPMAGGFTPAIGDQVTICGAYDEFFDQSQIQVGSAADITANGTAAVPAPESLGADEAGAEQWEGVLVQVDAVSVTMAANMFGEWVVDGALTLAPEFFAQMNWPNPTVGTNFASLTGVMTYTFGAFKLAPRNAADIEN